MYIVRLFVEGAGVREEKATGAKKGRGRTGGHGVPRKLVVDPDLGKGSAVEGETDHILHYRELRDMVCGGHIRELSL